ATRRGRGSVIGADDIVAIPITPAVAIPAIVLVITLGVPELRGLPIGAVDFVLADEVEVAVEPVEAGGAQRRGHLALERGLRMIVRAAFGLGNDERGRVCVTGLRRRRKSG